MSFRRALVDCAVLSLQDGCVLYPCCRGCFSRIDVDQQDTTRCRCHKCGYRCLREQVDYRYRLSLRVARDRCIFGITVFGNSLNPFFGIHATELQRLVGNLDGPMEPSTRFTLLVKAVEDCFIGRHFIFGIKIMEAESGLWFGGPVANGSSSKNGTQFVATQMILPKATGLGGCTVVSYYRILLQKAAESELISADTCRTPRFPATTPLLIHAHSSTSSFSDATLSASGFLSQSLQRSQYKDYMLTPTPPWQQSLGLVTSSAEQEEGCTQESGENSSQTNKSTAPHPAQRGCKENHKVTEELAPVLLLEHSVYGGPSFEKYANSSIEKGAGNSPSLNTWFSSSQAGQKRCSPKAKGFSTGQLTRTLLSSSLAWDDFPFSESLTEFLCEENKDFIIDSDTKPLQNVHRKEENARNHLGNTSLISETTTSCQRNAQIPGTHLQMLLDVTNTPAANGAGRHDSSSQECKHPSRCVNRSQAINVFSHERNQVDEAASSLSFQKVEEQQLEGDTYNCSADLFSSSLLTTMDAQRLSMHVKAIRTTTEACYENVNVMQSTPDKQELKSKFRESLIPQDTKDFDFVPPSQSTPIIKVGVVTHSPAPLYKSISEFCSQPDDQNLGVFFGESHEMDSKNNSVYKLNSGNATQALQGEKESTKENVVWSTTSSMHSHRLALKRRVLKPVKHKSHLHSQQHLKIQGKALNMSMNYKCESRINDVRESDCEDSAIIVPPTPAGNVQLSVPLRRRKLTDNSNNLGSTWEAQQRDEINCSTTLLDQTLTSSNRGLAQTENCDSETVTEGIFHHENQTCDWSKDLFSDSF